MRLVKFTRTDGDEAWVNPEAVSHVTVNKPPLVAGTGITFMNGLTLVVRERPEQAVIMLESS